MNYKEERMTLKEKIAYGLAVGAMMCGMLLLFLSFVVPPEGEIGSSVLYAFGEISLFSGSVLGISVQVASRPKRCGPESGAGGGFGEK